jgi:hypothetical protein
VNNQAFAPNMPIGYRIPDKPKDWFIYPVAFTTFAPGNATQTFQVDAASDFFLTQITFMAELDSTTAITVSTLLVPKVRAQITDGGSSRNLFNAQTPIMGFAGDGNHPHRLLHPRLFVRNSAITVTANNYSTATTYASVYIQLEGFRVYQ